MGIWKTAIPVLLWGCSMLGALHLLPRVALAQEAAEAQEIEDVEEAEESVAAEEAPVTELAGETAPDVVSDPGSEPGPVEARPEPPTEREALLERIRQRRRRRQANIAERVRRGEAIPDYVGQGQTSRWRGRSAAGSGRPNYTGLYVIGAVLLGIGAVVAFAAIFVANPPCVVFCSSGGSSRGDGEAAALTAGVGGGIGGLGILFLILGAVLDGQARGSSRVRAGPGDVGLGLEVAF